MDLIQNELINKAFTLGFKSYFGLMTSVNKECYHLWMADLQKWLREVHQLHITIFSSSQESWMFRITKPHQKLEEGIYGEDYTTYEEALEEGLKESLNLIK